MDAVTRRLELGVVNNHVIVERKLGTADGPL